MSDELAKQKCNQENISDMANLPKEQERNASIQFIRGLIDGYSQDHYAGQSDKAQDRFARKKALSLDAILALRKWLEQFESDAPGPGELQRIARAPGFRLVEILKFFCRQKTVELLIEPMHAEFLFKFYTALKDGNRWTAFSVKMQMYVWLVCAVVGKRVLQTLAGIFAGWISAKLDK